MTQPNESALQRYAPPAVWIFSALLALLIPLQILKLGYIPADDAMRHVAKAVSGKTWPEILVVRDGYGDDEHPGWHAILGAAHRVMNWDADALIAFSVVAPFALYWLALLAWRKRPEALLAALFAACLTAPATFIRPLFGRPFAMILVVFVVVLQLWSRPKKISPAQMILTVALIGISVWIHGSWYLFGIVIAAFALVGEWRKSFLLGACWLGGAIFGATLTGHPVAYLTETTAHLFDVFGGQTTERMLVTELRADPGDLEFIFVIGLALLWRVARGEWKREVVWNPVFALAAMGWLLGLKVSRFWTDWGFQAAIIWLAMELESALVSKLAREKVSALLLAAFVGAGVYIGTTRDIAGRWTQNLSRVFLTPDDPTRADITDWMPGKGGIVYSSALDVFFRTFYKNPHAEWRYMLGFEPGIMPLEDRVILRDIQRSGFAASAYAPWVKKMRAEDRLILLQNSPPNIKELKWYYAGGDTWIGRLPRTNFDAPAKP